MSSSLDFSFPFEQFGGVNVGLVSTLTVVHPLQTETDAENYLARLQQVAARVDEAIVNSRRIAAKGLIPPRFILNLTIAQMKQFAGQPAARNPLVTMLEDKLALVTSVSPQKREELRARAERIVTDQVYPAWQRAIALLEPLVARVNDERGCSD